MKLTYVTKKQSGKVIKPLVVVANSNSSAVLKWMDNEKYQTNATGDYVQERN